jgi:hypothetical protein
VWPIEVVIGGKLPEYPEQMALVEDDDVVQAFSADGAHQSLRDRVGLRRPIRRPDPNYAQLGEPIIEVLAVDVVSVVNQVDRLAIPGSCMDQLLPDPCRSGTGRHVQMDELASDVAHKGQDIQCPEADRLHHQQVGGPDPLRLIGQERPPGLARRAIRRSSPVPADGARADEDAQLEEFPTHSFCPPRRILGSHPSDQGPQLGAESRPPEPGSRPPCPVQAPTSPVPANHRLGSHNDQMPLPRARRYSTDPDPQNSVPISQAWSRLGSEEDLQLVAKGEILQEEIVIASQK